MSADNQQLNKRQESDKVGEVICLLNYKTTVEGGEWRKWIHTFYRLIDSALKTDKSFKELTVVLENLYCSFGASSTTHN